jgi:Raf kinase inhibitor-like YbhB/YbcL family protein
VVSKRCFMVVVIASVVLFGACKSEDDGDGAGGAGSAGLPMAGAGGMAGVGAAGTSGGGGAAGMAGASGASGASGTSGGAGAAAGTGGAGGSGGAAGAAGMTAGSGGAAGGGTGGASGMSGGGPLELTSSAFEDDGMLPDTHRCVSLGGDTGPSPALSWTGGPDAAMSYALTFTDVTPGVSMGFAHWTIYDIPAAVMSLSEGVPEGAMPAMPAGAKQSPNQSAIVGGPGYFGPCGGDNTYEFKLYALDVATLPGVTASSTAAQVRAQLDMHDIETATLTVMSGPP